MSNKPNTLSHQGKLLASCAAAGALLCASQAYADVVIDSFADFLEVEQIGVGVNSGTVVDGGGNMISSDRYMEATVTADPDTNGLLMKSENGNFNFNLGSSAQGSGLIQWDAFSATDLMANGEDSIAVGVVFDDLPIDLTFRVYSGTDWIEGTLNLSGAIVTETTKYLSFADFTVMGGSKTIGEVVRSATDIEMEITGLYAGTDLTINLVGTADDPDEPTYASLTAGPTSQPVSGGVALSWETDLEVNHAGFNVWRCQPFNDGYVEGEGQYNITDTGVVSGRDYEHALEAVDVDGNQQFWFFEKQ